MSWGPLVSKLGAAHHGRVTFEASAPPQRLDSAIEAPCLVFPMALQSRQRGVGGFRRPGLSGNLAARDEY